MGRGCTPQQNWGSGTFVACAVVGAGRCGAVAKLESGCRRTRQPMCSPFSLPDPPVTSARHASLGSHCIAKRGRARQSEFARGWKDSHS